MTTEVLEAPPAASQPGAAASTPAPAPAPAAAAPAGSLATATTGDTQQTADGQTPAAPGEGAQGSNPSDAGKPATPAAPEKYEFTAPEGHELDAPVVAAYSEVAKELGLSQDAAQKVVDKLTPVIAQAAVEKARAFYADIGGEPSTWVDSAKADKEFGGDKFDANLAVARKAMTFATPELRALLDKTGVGNHPEVIRWMYRVGSVLSEDSVVQGEKKPEAAPKSVAERLYPTSKT